MTKNVLGIAFALVLFAVSPGRAEVASLDEMTAPRIIGAEDAPLTVVEYFSLGCSHCAAFHNDTFPKVKEAFIDTGKVRFEFRDFPLGGPATAAAMLTRCAGPDRYKGFINLFFRTQDQWAYGDNPLAQLQKIARMGGMSAADVEQCLQGENSQPLLDFISNQARTGQLEHDVEATPTFLVGDQRIPGAVTFEDFKQVVEEELN